LDSVVGGNNASPLNLSSFCVAGCAADGTDNFADVAVVGGGYEYDGGGPLVYENWPLALEKIPYRGED
jgi:hypothetical protein